MNCEQIQAELDAFLDGEVEEGVSAEINRHVAGCPGCRRLLESHRAAALAVKGLPRAAAPQGFNERFRNARVLSGTVPVARAARHAGSSLASRLSWIGGSVAAAAALLVAVSLATSRREEMKAAPRAAAGGVAAQTSSAAPVADRDGKLGWRCEAGPSAPPAHDAFKEENLSLADSHRKAPLPPRTDAVPGTGHGMTARAPVSAPAPAPPPARSPAATAFPKPATSLPGAMGLYEAADTHGTPSEREFKLKAGEVTVAGDGLAQAERSFSISADSLADAEGRLAAISRSLGGYQLGMDPGSAAVAFEAPAPGGDKKIRAWADDAEDLKKAASEGRQSRTVVLALPADRLQTFTQALASWGGARTEGAQNKAGGEEQPGGKARSRALTASLRVAGELEESVLADRAEADEKSARISGEAEPDCGAAAAAPARAPQGAGPEAKGGLGGVARGKYVLVSVTVSVP